MIDALQQLHLLRPHWLWALALLPVLAWISRRRAMQASAWRDAVDAHLLPHLIETRPVRRHRVATWLALLAAALAIVALAGPSWQREPQPLWQARAPLVLALDLSGSIQVADLPPSRLAQARARLDTLLRERGDGQVGLIVYAEDAYVVAPLTDDAANVALFLDALHPSIMPGDVIAPGNPAPAIERAVRLLRQAGFDSGDILVLGGSAGPEAIAAAATAAADGYRVSALGLGTATGGPWRDASGAMQYARLDADELRALATAGGGRYATVAADGSDLEALGVLHIDPAGAVTSQDKAGSLWRDQGYWLLLPLMLLVAFGFRRHGVFAVLALCLCVPWHPAAAADGDWWRRPDQQAHQRLREGADAYHGEDYAAAADAWQGLPGADAHYNRGNALARLGRYEQAVAAYDEALRLQPGMEDAEANRQAVLEAMKRRPPQGGGDSDKGEDDKRDDGGKGGAGEAGRNDDASTAGGEEPEQPPSGAQPQPPGDDGDGDSDADAQPQRAPETAAEREQRLANEAWLRRIPDDPGGLLRERFRLEQYRRRQGGD